MRGVRSQRHVWRHRSVCADIIQWDVGTWKHALCFWEPGLGIREGGLGLELGGRDGGLSLHLALKGCRVVCSDLHGPTERARELHQEYGVAGLISYESIDAKAIPYPDGYFDIVILKSTLGALGSDCSLTAQREAVAEIHRVLRTDGQFLFAENMRGSPMHVFMRRRFVPWGRDWLYFTEGQIRDLLSDFSSLDLAFRGFAAALGRREWQRSLLHGVDCLVGPLLPAGLKYAVFGRAVK